MKLKGKEKWKFKRTIILTKKKKKRTIIGLNKYSGEVSVLKRV